MPGLPRPAVEALARSRLAALRAAGPPADLVSDFAAPIAAGALGELLGVALGDRAGFAQWSAGGMAPAGAADLEAVSHASAQLGSYLGDVPRHRGRRDRGTTVRRGEFVLAPLGAGNRDPHHVPDPDRIDLHRDGSAQLSFAPGLHHCLGAALARMQIQVALATLLTGHPTLQRGGGPEWQQDVVGQRTPVRVPATW